MYYTGKRIKYVAVKAIHITEKKLVETNCKEKGKEEKIGDESFCVLVTTGKARHSLGDLIKTA
jgi:hypothetical protein